MIILAHQEEKYQYRLYSTSPGVSTNPLQFAQHNMETHPKTHWMGSALPEKKQGVGTFDALSLTGVACLRWLCSPTLSRASGSVQWHASKQAREETTRLGTQWSLGPIANLLTNGTSADSSTHECINTADRKKRQGIWENIIRRKHGRTPTKDNQTQTYASTTLTSNAKDR